MDALVEVGKAVITVGVVVLVALVIPILFMFIFTIATGIDEKMNR